MNRLKVFFRGKLPRYSKIKLIRLDGTVTYLVTIIPNVTVWRSYWGEKRLIATEYQSMSIDINRESDERITRIVQAVW